MLSTARLDTLKLVVGEAKTNALRSKKNREVLAHSIASRLGMPKDRVQSFVDEMAGLNFYLVEDRLLFVEFAALGL